jgi:hypothetical protein
VGDAVVIDALRGFLNRPLPDADRRRLFVAALAVIAAVAAVLSLAGHRPSRTPAARHATEPAAPTGPTPVAAPASPPAVAPQAPSEEGRPDSSAGSHGDTIAAKHAARRFLVGYLPYTYGRRHAPRIAATTSRLRHELATERPRVPPRETRRHPTIVLVQADGTGRRRANLTALVGDGARRYTVALALARTRAGWLVTDVGN